MIEKNLVKNVYNHIASDFSKSRYKMWPMVADFVEKIPRDAFMIDLGCGNGKNLIPVTDHSLGLEISIGLAEICRERNLEVTLGDCTYTQIRDDVADYVISIAVLHHMATEKRRLQALIEVGRILKAGGKAMVTSWAAKQNYECGKKSNYASKEDSKDDNGPVNTQLPIHKARTEFKTKDLLVPFKGTTNGTSDDSEACHRYYHVFEESEMKELALKTNMFSQIEEVYDDGNYVLFLTRKK